MSTCPIFCGAVWTELSAKQLASKLFSRAAGCESGLLVRLDVSSEFLTGTLPHE